jgi:hypothetical protein
MDGRFFGKTEVVPFHEAIYATGSGKFSET